MALDYLAFHRIVALLKDELIEGKISKIYQISNEEFMLDVRNHGKNYHVLISTHPLMPYLNLVSEKINTIPIHTNLVLLLRKHLENGRIIDVKQQNEDRIVMFKIVNRDDYFQNSMKKLYVELIGRASNLILTDHDDMILDCLKKIPVQYNNLRTLLPNVTYTLPEKPLNQKLPISIENELANRNIGLDELKQMIASSNQVYISEKDNKKDFHFFPLTYIKGQITSYPWNVGIEKYYHTILTNERQRQNTASIEKIIKNELKKNNKKLDKLAQDLAQAELAKESKYYGDLLLTYGPEIKDLKNPVSIFDLQEQKNVIIPIDTRYDLYKNATLYYKKYQKSKVAQEKIKEQIDITNSQLDYLNSIAYYLKNADLISIKQIEEELTLQGMIKKKNVYNNKSNKKKSEKSYRPLQYQLNNITISVGENNLQNEYLTFKLANKNHYFFHVQKYHGAHVIVHSDFLDENLIRTAANLAVLHSEAYASSSVAVDFTMVKNVKKIPGGKPGKVLINKQRTIYIDPNKDLLNYLKKLS